MIFYFMMACHYSFVLSAIPCCVFCIVCLVTLGGFCFVMPNLFIVEPCVVNLITTVRSLHSDSKPCDIYIIIDKILMNSNTGQIILCSIKWQDTESQHKAGGNIEHKQNRTEDKVIFNILVKKKEAWRASMRGRGGSLTFTHLWKYET